jgi:murein DD-endopeptidase MepM/ murein hydrolase activator NlpD
LIRSELTSLASSLLLLLDQEASMNITNNRTTSFYDLKLNLPDHHLSLKPDASGSMEEKLKELKKDTRPLQFSTPLYNPLNPQLLSIVHTPSHPTTGGLFGETARGKPHHGLDIKANIGTGVTAAEDGVVVFAGSTKGYGNVIYVNHRGGYQTRYAHLSKINVKEGERVEQGELMGESGKTGNAADPKVLAHLHFEIRKIHEEAPLTATQNQYSTPIDPLPLITTKPVAERFHLADPLFNYRKWLFLLHRGAPWDDSFS